ncbi:MAG: helix-hairpin-helix domain-containing protein [Patescibacteria group bacterium]
MENLKKLFGQYRKYLVEIVLIAISMLIVVISFVLYIANANATAHEIKPSKEEVKKDKPLVEKTDETIFVDITGSVMKPDSYELSADARLKDALTKAAGLSELADKDFFYRNFNLARQLSDQEKIYIPSITEVSNGIFKETYRLIEPTVTFSTDSQQDSQNETGLNPNKVHINNATIDELDTLPSVGTTIAQKIIDNRPYTSIDELTSKKVVGEATFNKFKDQIDL